MLYKISFQITDKQFKKYKIIDLFENVVFEKNKKIWKVFIISNNRKNDLNLLNFFLKKINQLKINVLKKQNWVLLTQKKDKPVVTNLFTISQNKSISFLTKNFLQVPAANAFGTGKHHSTFLIIKNIEWLIKKKKFFKFLDLGCGTGILAFILAKIFKKKIFTSDFENDSEKSVNYNKKLNEVNKIFFIKCFDFRSIYFKGKKFDLIVSNILLSPLKKNTSEFCKHLISGGYIIISGILKTQINDIRSHYGKFNLKLVKSIYINNWASMIFRKI